MDGKSLAFEARGKKLKVLIEEAPPFVTFKGRSYLATEKPSVIVAGRKYFVEDIV
ncbi:MAG: hypothetical protein QW275_03150 [Candidatus Anstonellaceae archaeon]